ncbi:MAG: hypothetical protein AAGA56_28780 [Myxococcota bacterium]
MAGLALMASGGACASGTSADVSGGAGGAEGTMTTATDTMSSATTASTTTTTTPPVDIGGDGDGGAGGDPVAVGRIRVTVDHLRFIGNGDLLGKGDNDYEVKVVVDGVDELIAAQNDIKTSNGEVVAVGEFVDVMFSASDTPAIEVSFWADDDGSGSNETVMASRTHMFDPGAEQWTDVGDDLKLRDADGQLDVELQYDFVVLP